MATRTAKRTARTTPSENAPMRQSDEADARQLDLARKQGAAYVKALQHMTDKVANGGGERRAGQYVVGYAHEDAEGMYRLRDGELEWHEATGNIHIEISVRDAGDDRFVPGLDVRLTIIDEDGQQVGSRRMPFIWHPWLYHYGRNWKIPGDGTYRLLVDIAPPAYMRHDEENGQRYAEPVTVVFDGVKLETGSGD